MYWGGNTKRGQYIGLSKFLNKRAYKQYSHNALQNAYFPLTENVLEIKNNALRDTVAYADLLLPLGTFLIILRYICAVPEENLDN